MIKANVYVTLQRDVLDPQGVTIKNALSHLNFNDINNVRVGKFFEIYFNNNDREKVKEEIEVISREVLSNPVIEEFNYEIVENDK